MSPSPTWLNTLATNGRSLVKGLFHLVYPNICWICRQSVRFDEPPFCEACRTALWDDPHATCPRCAASVGPFVPLEEGCTRCRELSLAFDGVLRLGPYDGIFREVILRMKNLTGEGLADALGELWARHAETELRAVAADMIVPVPLHWWRRWARGYNQSEALARALARVLGLPCRPRVLRRQRPTPPQHHLTSVTAKRDNVKGAFAVNGGANVKGQTILLVDDVLTTSSTAHEAARPLRAAGAAKIVVAVLARAAP